DDPRPGLALAVASGHDMVLPGTWSLLPAGKAFVDEAHAAGMRVGTWVVDDAPTVRDLCGWGLDAIASNDPAMALAAVAGA
ncbi:MAG: glycerophosphodiester phosphodiesterase family protein, partial [Actinomycetota bacterium]